MNINPITFKGMPPNYSKVDDNVSRSAQPMAGDLVWLKKRGVTDILNFRTMIKSSINYDEESIVKKLGMNYHSIPSITTKPTRENIEKFLSLAEEVNARGGKLHIHCKSGADRTGMYSFIYKAKNNIGSIADNVIEWFDRGFHVTRYPELLPWTLKFIKKHIKGQA